MGANVSDYDAGLASRVVDGGFEYGEQAFGRSRPFTPGTTPIPPSGKVIGGPEISNAIRAVLEGVLTAGPWTTAFERLLAATVGVRHASMCNSGSSANLLALAALRSAKCPPELRLAKGDEVVTAAVGFPTTLNAILQAGLKPVFVDIELGTYVPSSEAILGALSDKTGAVFMAHTLGNPFPLDIVDDIRGWGATLVEDNCDALGSTYMGRMTGGFGIAATQSFYPAHHITTGEGGAVLTNSGRMRRAIESLRDWGRDCWCEPGADNTCGKRFEHHFDGLPAGYDHKYVYSEVGYNLKSTDIQAAIGMAQLERLRLFTAARRANFGWLMSGLADLGEHLILPRASEWSEPSWFGFPITLMPGDDRETLLRFLNERRIGTRNLFGGNLLRQPAYRGLAKAEGWKVCGPLNCANIATDSTFWIGCWPGISKPMIDYVVESFHDYYKHG